MSLDGVYDSYVYSCTTAGTNLDATVWYGGIPELYIDEVVITSILAQDVPGDTNGDRIVDATDAANVAQHWGTTVTQGDYAQGDFNNDGLVDAADASIMAANWGDHNAPPELESTAAVPEPSTVVLLFGLSLVLVLERRK